MMDEPASLPAQRACDNSTPWASNDRYPTFSTPDFSPDSGDPEPLPTLAAIVAGALEEPPGAWALDSADTEYLERTLAHNLRTGRACRVLTRQQMPEFDLSLRALADSAECDRARRIARLGSYIRTMATVYAAERSRIQALARNDPAAWNLLCEHLTRQAFQLLLSRGAGRWFAHDKASELAQQACVRIFGSVYPCDISFDLWAATILKNLVRHYMARSQDLLDRNPSVQSIEMLDEQGREPEAHDKLPPPHDHQQPSATTLSPALAFGDCDELVDAIRRIRSSERKAVLILTYFHELDDGEIAAQIGKSRGAVQTLRSRALSQLRGWLARLGYSAVTP